MIQLTLIELFKIVKRPRTYIGFLAIFLTVGAMQLAMFYEGEELISIAIQNLENDFRLEGKIINTNLMTYILLNSLIIHIPILICLVTGDAIAGEASSGTLRLISTKTLHKKPNISSKSSKRILIYRFIGLFFSTDDLCFRLFLIWFW